MLAAVIFGSAVYGVREGAASLSGESVASAVVRTTAQPFLTPRRSSYKLLGWKSLRNPNHKFSALPEA
jgi:hypothetical protein